MNRNVFLVLLGALAFAGLILIANLVPKPAGPEQPFEGVNVTIASSSTKKEWLEDSVRRFNEASKSQGAMQVDGKAVRVEILLEEIDQGKFDHYRSGTMVSNTMSGQIKPTVLSPAEETWIGKLNFDWKGASGSEITSGKPTPLVRTPLVIAMWQSRATALGCWPVALPECTWANFSALAGSESGWGKLGKPEWGKLKFGYGFVGESNSGTLTAALLCMSGAGKLAGLVFDDVDPTRGCGLRIAQTEKAKVHSGKKSDWLLGWMQTGGPEYLDAVTTYEQEVIEFNRANAGKLREPLVAAYPQDGTVVVEHPYAILDKAPWVSPDQVRGAELFRDFLLTEERQQALIPTGLRPANPAVKAASPIETRYGANPEAYITPVILPDALVMDRITEVWHRAKKHAVIALVFDKSGSMRGEKLTTAINGVKEFVTAMDREDELLWMPFSDRVYEGDRGPKSAIGEKLLSSVSGTVAEGDTALYDAIFQAYNTLKERRSVLGDSTRYGIVVLSDGVDTSSKRSSLATIQSLLKATEGDASSIQIHTIGIGEDADKGLLTQLASMAHGRYWDARNPKNTTDIYRQIAVHY
jgi:Ca-activated chloride channel family protein